MIFSGEYECRADPQGRVSVPARFRPAFEAGIVLSKAYDRCLMVYTTSEFEVAAEEVLKGPRTRTGSRRLARLTFAGAHELALDRHGRLLVPTPLREYAGLGEQVVIVGTGKTLEIWSKELWSDERTILDDESAEIAERAGVPADVEDGR